VRCQASAAREHCPLSLTLSQRRVTDFMSADVNDRLSGFGGEGAVPMPADLAKYPEYARPPSREAYLEALAEAMRFEYRAIHAAGFMLQIDCLDLAMGAHIEYAGATLEELRRNLSLHVEALNHVVADIPPERMRMHLCWSSTRRRTSSAKLQALAEGARIASQVLRHAPPPAIAKHV